MDFANKGSLRPGEAKEGDDAVGGPILGKSSRRSTVLQDMKSSLSLIMAHDGVGKISTF